MTPFDSFCLAAVTSELRKLVGARAQKVWQPDPLSVVISLYQGTERLLLLTASPQFARAHLISKRPPAGETLDFCAQLRKRLTDSRLELVRQRGLDRVLELGFSGSEGDYLLVAELMGKHSNLMLLDSTKRVVTAAKWVGSSKSRRPILPGQVYAPPPFEPKPSLLSAVQGDHLGSFEGASPFLVRLMESGVPLAQLQGALRSGSFHPVVSPGYGGYPWGLETLGVEVVAKASISEALDSAFAERISRARVEQARSGLGGRLRKLLAGREATLEELAAAVGAADRARETQMTGELILAYQGSVRPGTATLTAWDHEGQQVTVSLDPGKTAIENAEQYFARARKAKRSVAEVRSQRERVEADCDALREALALLDAATDERAVQDVEAMARVRRWLVDQRPVTVKEERPFEGHAIRETLSPGGFRVLYGTNATSNDYLTTKFAKPNDWWLHVRGAASAHVVLVAGKAPDKVPTPDLLFAAEVAVHNSPSKHSSYVAVDYTLKKYVRKPRGSAPGLATYTHERTLHVDGRIP